MILGHLKISTEWISKPRRNWEYFANSRNQEPTRDLDAPPRQRLIHSVPLRFTSSMPALMEGREREGESVFTRCGGVAPKEFNRKPLFSCSQWVSQDPCFRQEGTFVTNYLELYRRSFSIYIFSWWLMTCQNSKSSISQKLNWGQTLNSN